MPNYHLHTKAFPSLAHTYIHYIEHSEVISVFITNKSRSPSLGSDKRGLYTLYGRSSRCTGYSRRVESEPNELWDGGGREGGIKQEFIGY